MQWLKSWLVSVLKAQRQKIVPERESAWKVFENWRLRVIIQKLFYDVKTFLDNRCVYLISHCDVTFEIYGWKQEPRDA